MHKIPTKETPIMSNSGVLDTRFRSALERMAMQGRICAYTARADAHLEIAAIMKELDGGPALVFTDVAGYAIPVVGNLLSCRANCEAAFGIDFNGIRDFIGRALGSPKPPVLVEKAPAQERVHLVNIDLPAMLPPLLHTPADPARFDPNEFILAIPIPAPTMHPITGCSWPEAARAGIPTTAGICGWPSNARTQG
jgi:3-polyprenyl-4-hydroxybenzoate decarboxylase